MPLPIRLVTLDDKGHWQRQDIVTTDPIAAMEARGYTFTGSESRRGLRSELQGQPKFLGLLGPMWDGDAIRYEDKNANNALSI